MPAFVAGILALAKAKTWMAGMSPAMTAEQVVAIAAASQSRS